MKAFMIRKPHCAELAEVEKPEAAPGEVLIKVAAAGFCGTDIHTFRGEYPSGYPIIPGHEFAGTVEKTGSGVTRFKPGDRVVADPNVFCESCFYCLRNQQIHCENISVIGNFRHGALAEYVTAPERCLFHSLGIDPLQAAMAEPLACVINAHNKAAVSVGGDVLIFGAGTIGLMHLMLARRRGAARTVIVDVKPAQLDLAKRIGADAAVLSDAGLSDTLSKLAPRGFGMIIDATGVPKVVEKAITHLMKLGTFIAFGVCPMDSAVTINPFELYHNEWRLIGSYALQKNMDQSVAMLGDGKMSLSPLIGEVIGIGQVPDRFAAFVRGETSNKIIVEFE
ncbi:MAG: zinc-dependent alcohol dehydrogenase family protein [Planctomycetota bacterium]|jgi:2-desacetyl-2-hydroxyethyl bacteriochlorophyllide A dehydrogenase|nr:zinc-dependent alcohol dehydrogenase family protein [Planctomycetota bacterium]